MVELHMSETTRSNQRAGRRAGTAAAALVVLGALGAASYSGVLLVDHASQEVYAIPRWGVGLTLGLLALSIFGCGLIVWSRQAGFSAVVLGGAALGVLGLLAIFSFGLLALVIASGLLGWAAAGRWPGRRRGRAAVGAVLAGAPLPLLVVFAMGGPLVDCDADGSSSEENLFMGVASGGGSTISSGSATRAPGGTESGHAQGGGYEYSYACRGEKLVRFNLRWR